MKELKDKNCFLTGAASGIGRAFAISLAKEGINLFITDIDMENLAEVKKEIEQMGVKVHAEKCDVSKFSDFEYAAKEFYSKLGDLDLLINNAGITIGGGILELELEDWKQVLDVNLWSVIHSLKVFLPHMLEKHSGHIVNVSSGSGVIGTTDPLPYISSKFAVVGISEALYSRIKNQGINISVVIPSYIRTNIFTTSKVKYSQKLLDDIGQEKVDEIYKSIVEGMASRAMLPSRAIKKYIAGIKKNQLYISDLGGTIAAMALKVTNPQKYEDFLVNFYESNLNYRKEIFRKYGINIDDYLYKV